MKPLTVYHGKVGKGLSIEMAVKHGPVTLYKFDEASQQFLSVNKLLQMGKQELPSSIAMDKVGNL